MMMTEVLQEFPGMSEVYNIKAFVTQCDPVSIKLQQDRPPKLADSSQNDQALGD